jgi:hypothetical protein
VRASSGTEKQQRLSSGAAYDNSLTRDRTTGANYRNLAAAKSAAKKARASAPKGQRPRDLLRERAIEMAREKDQGKGGKKGWF